MVWCGSSSLKEPQGGAVPGSAWYKQLTTHSSQEGDWMKLFKFRRTQHTVSRSGRHRQCKTADVRLWWLVWYQIRANTLELYQWPPLANTPNSGLLRLLLPKNHWPEDLGIRNAYSTSLQKHGGKDYLVRLHETRAASSRRTGDPEIAVGYMALLYNDSTKSVLWKLAIVKELLPWNEDRIRAAVIQVAGSRTLLKRSIKHLIPIEVKSNVDTLTEPDGPIQFGGYSICQTQITWGIERLNPQTRKIY